MIERYSHMTIQIADDFDLDRIAQSGQCFRWERIKEKSYRVLHGADCLYIEALGNGCFRLDCDEEAYRTIWRDYFDLEQDYRAVRARIDPEADPFLWAASEHEKGIRILRQDSWETLISFIISQNKNIPAIQRCIKRLTQACGEEKRDGRGEAYFAFPGPKAVFALPEEALADCSLGYRGCYVHEAARAVLEKEIDLNALMDTGDEETLTALMTLKGVGKKVANCVSLFGLHHINAFPRDVWINRILENEYPEGYPFAAYSPYNGIFQQYMFAYYRNSAAESAKEKEA